MNMNKLIKYLVVFSIMTFCIGINMSAGFLSRLGLHPDMLMVAGVAGIAALFGSFLNIPMLAMVTVMTLLSNATAKTAASIGYAPSIMLACTVALLLLPFLIRLSRY